MFAHLHVHTVFSFGEALGTVKDYITEAKRNKQTALAKTDNGLLCGSYQFYSECKKAGIKPILGQDFYVAQNDKADVKDSSSSKWCKVVVLAKNQQGWKNINILSSLAFTTYSYYKPRVDSKLLFKYREGLIVLSGGTDGVVGSRWAMGEEKKALEMARRYKAIFNDDFYLEVLPIEFRQQIDFNKFLLELKKIDNFKMVAANCCFYPKEEQAKYYPYLLMIKNNMRQNEFRSRDRQIPDSLFLKSRDEMFDSFERQGFQEKQIDKWLDATQEIVDKIEDIEFEKSFKLPNFQDFQKVKDEVDDVKEAEPSLLD